MLVRMWRKGNPCALFVGGNVNWYSHYGKRVRLSLKKLKIEPPYNPVILLLDIYLEKKKENTNLKKYTHPHFYCSTINSNQDMETMLSVH